MSEISKQEDIVRYELDALKEIKEKLSKGEERVRRNDILRGVTFGLILGILGLLFIQSLYSVTRVLLLGQNSPTFTVDVAICAISLLLIVCVAVILYRQLTRCENKLQLSKKSQDVLDYAIKRRERSLEEAKKNNNQKPATNLIEQTVAQALNLNNGSPHPTAMYIAVGAFRHLEDSSFPFAEYRAYHENEKPNQNKNLPAASKI